MVFIALPCVVVSSEAFACSIVIVISSATSPTMTFNAEVIVARTCQIASSSSTLKQALRQCYTGRNVIFKHLLYRQILILVNVCLVCRVPLNLRQSALHINHCAQ